MKDFSKTHLVFIVLFLVVGLGGGYFWYWSVGDLEEKEGTRAGLQSKISQVEKKGLPPSAAVLAKLKENDKALEQISEKGTEELKTTVDLFDSVVIKQEPGRLPQGLPSDSWKKLMNEKRLQLNQLAQTNKVTVPKDPYYGFKRFQLTNPPDSATGQLGIELLGATEISTILMDAKVKRFDWIKRVFVEDGKNPQGTPGGNEEMLAASVLPGPENLYTVYPFEVLIRCSTADLRTVINNLNQSKYFFIIRFLMVESEKANVKSRSAIQADMTGDTVKGQLMVPVAGNEYLQVRLRIDMLVWSKSVVSKESAPAANGGAR